MRLRAGVLSDCGLVRPSNEDSFFLRRGLYAVCDGMGGARAGEVASQMACMGLLGLDPASSGKKELRSAVVSTNQAIVSRSLAEDDLLGMGTTLTAAMLKEGSLILAHVGDSRAYLFHNNRLTQLTDDHSWVGEMVRRGELTPEQAAVHPHRSVITRALGTDREVDPDIREMAVEAGDRILLCSDGLTGMVKDEQIAEVFARQELPQATAESLVKAALAAGGEDNVTVVIVDVLAGDPEDTEADDGDQVGDGVILGPTDRGVAVGLPHRGRRAGASVRERFGRRTTPVLRPVGPGATSGAAAKERTSGASEQAGSSDEPDRSAGESGVSGTTGPAAAQSSGEDALRVTSEDAEVSQGVSLPVRQASVEGTEPSRAVKAETGGSPPVAGGAAGAPGRRSRRRRWFYLLVAIVVILAIAVAAFAFYNSSVYYVGKYDDTTVALYRGLPASFLGIELSSAVELAAVDYDSLASYLRGRVDAHDLVSKEEGRAFLKTLGEQQ